MKQSNIPGDLISFGGVAIALGMIIDATIIMVEKLQTASRESSADNTITEIVLAGAKEVGRPIFFAIAMIIIVFLPIFTLGEIEGKMFRPLAFTVAATMIGSLFYALFISPILFRLFHKTEKLKPEQSSGMSNILAKYEKGLNCAIHQPRRITIVILVLAVVAIIVFTGLGREFVPTLQEGTLQCLAHLNPNVSLEEIKMVCSKISREISRVPEVVNVIADIGYGEVGPHVHHTNFGCITITLTPKSKWKTSGTQEGLVSEMDAYLSDFLGTSISFSQPINHEVDGLIAGAGAAVVAKVFGEDMDQLISLAGELEHLLADQEGVADLRTEQVSGQTQLQIDLDSSRLSRYGLDKHEVQALIRQAVNGEETGFIFEGEKAFRIFVRLDKYYSQNEESIRDLLIRTSSGSRLPLRELADISTVTGLRQISREDTQRYVSVQCNVRGIDVGTFVTRAQEKVDESMDLPTGYRIAWGGQFELQQAANKRLLIVVPITLLLVLGMLYGLFGSLRNVLLIALNLPLSLIGGVLALGIAGENISIPSSIGFIALFGIALTDGVVLISRIESLRNKGLDLRDSIIKGCRSKFRPVIMTTITTALGLLPLILTSSTGAEVQRPLAIVVLGGLITSTLLTLFVLPSLYALIQRKNWE